MVTPAVDGNGCCSPKGDQIICPAGLTEPVETEPDIHNGKKHVYPFTLIQPRSCRLIHALVLILVMVPAGVKSQTTHGLENGSWHLAADTVIYDRLPGRYTAEGRVVITGTDARLAADRITFDPLTRDTHARGNVRLDAGEDRITCEALTFNLDTQTGIITNGTVFVEETHFYIRGDTIQKTGKETYTAGRAEITACDGNRPDWKITARDVQVTVEGYGRASHATLWAKRLPALYSPILLFPVKNKRQTGLLIPHITTSDRKGFEIEQPLFLALSETTDATLTLDHMTRRGTLAGLEYRYRLSPESRGTVMATYLKDDTIDDGTDKTRDYRYSSTPTRDNDTRYWLRMKADQLLGQDLSAQLDIDVVSDADYLREFKKGETGYTRSDNGFESDFGRGLDTYSDTTRTNRLNIRKTWDGSALNLEALWYDNVTARQTDAADTTLQSLPVLRYDAVRRQLGSLPLFAQMNAEAVSFFRQDTTDSDVNGSRLDIFPQLAMPFHLKGIHVEPVLGFRQTLWHTRDITTDSGLDSGFIHRELPEAGLKVSSTLSRIFRRDSDASDAFKHEVSPSLSYQYIPDVDQDHIPLFDDVDQIEERNTLTWELTSRLTRRTPRTGREGEPAHTYRELGWFRLSQDYRFSERDEDAHRFSDILMDLELNPAAGFFLDSELAWSPHGNRLTTHNSGLTLKNSRKDRISCHYRYTRADTDTDGTESVYLKADLGLLPGIRAFTIQEQNLLTDTTIESTTGIEFNRSCWALHLTYSDTPDDRSIGFRLFLSGIGAFGNP